jgi:Uma2 family endonuclease
MSLAKEFNPVATFPTSDIIRSDELWSDEPQLETPLHLEQIILLLVCLKWWWRDRLDFFASGNISIFYERRQLEGKPDRAKGPDFFVVLNTQPKERKSWVVWDEGDRFPNVIVEILSKKTAKVDRVEKKALYQNTFKTPEYFWFHPYTLEFAGFRLTAGQYNPIAPTASGWLWSEQLQLFLGIHNRKLRYFTSDGTLVPIPEEQVEIERQRLVNVRQQLALTEQQREHAQQQAELERQQREHAQQQAELERQQREHAQQQAELERQQREHAQQQLSLTQQQLSEMEELLRLYRERFGELPEGEDI